MAVTANCSIIFPRGMQAGVSVRALGNCSFSEGF